MLVGPHKVRHSDHRTRSSGGFAKCGRNVGVGEALCFALLGLALAVRGLGAGAAEDDDDEAAGLGAGSAGKVSTERVRWYVSCRRTH